MTTINELIKLATSGKPLPVNPKPDLSTIPYLPSLKLKASTCGRG